MAVSIKLETITSKENRSFSMMFNPRLSDLYFWHLHPEYELVYIQAETGRRCVGEHQETFHKQDLVLIGSNIPHLNFDYGIKSDYKKVVVHLKKTFVEETIPHTPELLAIHRLFSKSKHGIVFRGQQREDIGNALFALEHSDSMDQYLRLMQILYRLSEEPQHLLHDRPFEINHSDREQDRLRKIYSYVEEHYHEKIPLEQIASLCNLSKESFCRYFKKASTYTFVEFLNRYRISHSKYCLINGDSVSEACYQSGFESLSYYNRVFRRVTGENPSDFRLRQVS